MYKAPLITDRKTRFALVGCGRISANHFGAINKHADRVALVDVCDENAIALQKAVAHTKARGHLSLTEMLKTTDADLVVLATPSGLHADQAIQVSKSGRHVMTEKPMATRWSDGLSMVKACDDATCAFSSLSKTAETLLCNCSRALWNKVVSAKYTPLL
jgi:UDP-N-acetyl-2-amino-2-deoxyglucuronate dehydrogenase